MAEEVVLCRDLNDYRACGSAPRNLTGAADRLVDFRSSPRLKLRFCGRPRDRKLVHAVELEGSARIAANPTSQNEHGDAIEEGFGNTRECVRQARAGDHVHHGKLAGRPRNTIGHEGSALFVRDQDGAHFRGTGQRVVKLDIVCARNAEGKGDAFIFQRAYDHVAASHFCHNNVRASLRMVSATRSAKAIIVR